MRSTQRHIGPVITAAENANQNNPMQYTGDHKALRDHPQNVPDVAAAKSQFLASIVTGNILHLYSKAIDIRYWVYLTANPRLRKPSAKGARLRLRRIRTISSAGRAHSEGTRHRINTDSTLIQHRSVESMLNQCRPNTVRPVGLQSVLSRQFVLLGTVTSGQFGPAFISLSQHVYLHKYFTFIYSFIYSVFFSLLMNSQGMIVLVQCTDCSSTVHPSFD